MRGIATATVSATATALVFSLLVGASAVSAQPALCTEPNAHCGAALPASCLESLGAGAAAVESLGCEAHLARYRNCLQRVARDCAPARAAAPPAAGAAAPGRSGAAFSPFSLRCQVTEIDQSAAERYRGRIDPGEGDTRNRRYFEKKIAAEERKIDEAFASYAKATEYTVLGRARLYDWTRERFMQSYVSETRITGVSEGRIAAQIAIDRQNGGYRLELVGEGKNVRAFGACAKISLRPVQKANAF